MATEGTPLPPSLQNSMNVKHSFMAIPVSSKVVNLLGHCRKTGQKIQIILSENYSESSGNINKVLKSSGIYLGKKLRYD